MSGGGMNTPLLDTIEPDEPSEAPQPQPKAATHKPVVLTPTNRATEQYASTSSDAESGAYDTRPKDPSSFDIRLAASLGIAGILRQVRKHTIRANRSHSRGENNSQSAHPIALMFLYFFRIAAIVMYILGGYFNNYVLSVRTKSQTHSQERSG
jgi:hypothetical protein